MKLVYIANIRLPTEKAHGVQIMKMCEALVKQQKTSNTPAELAGKRQVELIVPWRFNRLRQDSFDYYVVERVFKIKKIPSIDLMPLEKLLGQIAFWIQTFSFAFFSWLYCFRKTAIVYSRDLFSVFFLKNYVLEIHALPIKLNWLHKRALNRARGFVTVTSFLKKRLQELGFSQLAIVAPDAVDLKIFDIDISKENARRQLQLPTDKFIIGYTGKFTTMGEEKGLGMVLDALQILVKKYSDILFLAVGGEPRELEEYKKLAQAHGVPQQTFFVTHVPQKMLAVYQKAADVLVMPFPFTHHYAYEMSPMKMFEYMASRRPIIASRLPAVEEILRDNKSVILFNSGDARDLAMKIESAYNNSVDADTVAQKAHALAKKYTWDERARIIKKFIVV